MAVALPAKKKAMLYISVPRILDLRKGFCSDCYPDHPLKYSGEIGYKTDSLSDDEAGANRDEWPLATGRLRHAFAFGV